MSGKSVHLRECNACFLCKHFGEERYVYSQDDKHWMNECKKYHFLVDEDQVCDGYERDKV